MTKIDLPCVDGVASCSCGWRVKCGNGVTHLCRIVGGAVLTAATIGPGTELKKILARMGITSAESCPCNAHAQQMDAWGDECELHMDEILEWLRLQAESRGLPFIRAAAALLVRMSIRSYRRLKQRQQ